MTENTWLKLEREFFTGTNAASLKLSEKVINTVLEKYNRFLQKALLGDSPYIAEDLKLTILKSEGGNVSRKS